MALDLIGNVSLSLQIVILFLLVLGLPFVRGQANRKNLMWHGYSTLSALVLHTILIFLVMIPSFSEGLLDIASEDLFTATMVWSHVILGTAAEVIGIILVASWLSRDPTKLTCYRWKKWMTPLLTIWIISIINGAIIHVLSLM